MATAAALNALGTVINGQGFAVNPAITANISTFQSQTNFTLLTTIYANANTYGNVANVVVPILNTLGSTATQAQFLLDIYPSNITPASSASVAYRFGNHPSASGTIQNQANGPFDHGITGFANVFIFAQAFASSSVDSSGSLYMLKDKTYGQSGLGYNGITDLITGGIGNPAQLLGNTVAGWGTMYNITNINLIADPYVFGQNILDHGFGTYGNLDAKLTATGLDTTDITRVPATKTTTTSQTSTLTTQTSVGAVELPTITNVTVTNTVTANSPDVVLEVYKTITGTDLSAIISATGFDTTGTTITTLADLLDFKRAIDVALQPALAQLGITDFATFTQFLNSRVGQGAFSNWSAMSKFLTTVSVPQLPHITTTASSPVLNPSAVAAIQNLNGSGTGPFNNPIMVDMLGACSGTPYTTYFPVINSNYASLVVPVYTALLGVNSAVNQVNAGYLASAPGDEANCVVQSSDIAALVASVSGVDTAMNNLSGTAVHTCQTAYYIMLNHVTTEVSNLAKAGVVFNTGPARLLQGFGQRVPSLGGPDPMAIGTDTFIANVITNDAAGDTIRAAMSEFTNTNVLGKSGITLKNDPNPIQAISQSRAQNISLSTYLSQNK